MPGRLLQKTYDENALLTQFPAMCLTILGAVAGNVLQSKNTDQKKLLQLYGMSAAGIALGLLWGTFFAINKHLWSSSFILLTAGMAFAFLATFYWVIDVQGVKKWAFFFKVIGMNALVIYLMVRFVDFDYSSKLLFSGFYGHLADQWHPACNALGSLALQWIVLYILYRKKIFVKV
jgi:predicted acyltransferase